jgi:prepilin-type N-terminal cleavage/methylation domain-containing protein
MIFSLNKLPKVRTNALSGGFTLIELLVAMGVLAIISGIAISIFITLSSSYDKASVVSTVNSEGTRIMELIARTIRNSSSVESISSQRIQLTIGHEAENLEYSTNGQCGLVDIYYDSATKTIQKSTPVAGGNCVSTPVCPDTNPCILSADIVDVNNDLVFTVTSPVDTPASVRVVFTLKQDASLSDPQQQSSQQFERVILTRGY